MDQSQIPPSVNSAGTSRLPETAENRLFWPRDDLGAQYVEAAPPAAQVARGSSDQPDVANAESEFETMPLMSDCPSDIFVPGFGGPQQQQTNVSMEEPVIDHRSLGLQGLPGFEPDIFGVGIMSQDIAYWDVSQYLDTLYQSPGPGPEFGFARSVDMTETSEIIEASISELELDPNVASPPAPSFLDARASPEPMEGQSLRYDDYVRKVFGNRRHLHGKDAGRSGSRGPGPLEKAHDPPIMGDFPPSLAVGADDSVWESESLEHVPYLPRHVYEQIAMTFQNVNTTRGTCIQFAGGQFPSLTACNAFMQLYFEEFNPLFPFIHQPTFDPAETPWLLVLATIATGIRFAREPAAAECGDMMQEFLRRAFLAMIESDYYSLCEPWLAQVGLLNQIGMTFSRDMRLFQGAQSMRSLLSSICRQVNCFQELRRPASIDVKEQSIEEVWRFWLRRESMRRLAYTLWLIDSQYLLFFDLPPVIPMKLLRVRLPCYESLWYAPTATAWLKCHQQKDIYAPLSIREELDRLYQSHVRNEGLGDFSLLLMTVGVFRNAMDARRALEEGACLMPCLVQSEALPGQSPHQIPDTFSTTRKAMEYLQILCSDHDELPRVSSLKSAVIHHYHAIGLLLRIPLGELFCYCGYRVTSTDIAHCETRLISWMRKRGEEARQMVSHAGRLFAHIRRSNLHYHYEGRMMFIACQALWIYTAISEAARSSLGDQSTQATETPTRSIRLDQSLDTEAGETWLRDGGEMRPFLAGVGRLHGGAGVARLIREGVRVMCAPSAWPLNNVQGKCLLTYHQVRSGFSEGRKMQTNVAAQ